MTVSWKKYLDNRKDKGERELLRDALHFVVTKNIALDLGAGSLNDSKYLLNQGFKHVIAIDNEPAAIPFAQEIKSDHFEFVRENLENAYYQRDYYDLINAQYVLPYFSHEVFSIFFPKILTSLKEGGIFCCQLFGNRDSWVDKKNNMCFFNIFQVQKLFSGMEIIKFYEEDKDGTTALGTTKHIHVFHIIAKKS